MPQPQQQLGIGNDTINRKLAAEKPIPSDPPEYQRSYKADLDPYVFDLLRYHRVLRADGTPVMTVLEGRTKENHDEGERGPILEVNAWQRLIAADTTPDHHWTAWILDKAAGGENGVRAADVVIGQVKDQFIKERVDGFVNELTGERYAPVSEEEARRRWSERRPHQQSGKVKASPEERFMRIMMHADEDHVDLYHCYGFWRKWPGSADRDYKAITETVAEMISLESKIEQYNKDVSSLKGDESEAPVPLYPTEWPARGLNYVQGDRYKTLDELRQTVKKIKRHFGARAAVSDYRVAGSEEGATRGPAAKFVYTDQFVDAICPLTYAAAVRYGFNNWPWANRDSFKRYLRGTRDNGARPPNKWKDATTDGFFIILRFKRAMPGYAVRRGNDFKTVSLVNLAVKIPFDRTDTGSLVFWDEEGHRMMSYAQVLDVINNDVDRPLDKEQAIAKNLPKAEQDNLGMRAEWPVKDWRTFKTKEEATEVATHFEKAMAAILKWADSFDTSRLVRNTVGTEE